MDGDFTTGMLGMGYAQVRVVFVCVCVVGLVNSVL